MIEYDELMTDSNAEYNAELVTEVQQIKQAEQIQCTLLLMIFVMFALSTGAKFLKYFLCI